MRATVCRSPRTLPHPVHVMVPPTGSIWRARLVPVSCAKFVYHLVYAQLRLRRERRWQALARALRVLQPRAVRPSVPLR